MTAVTMTLLIGTYATGDAQGVYACEFNPTTGVLTAPQLVVSTPTPGFLSIAADGKHAVATGRGAKDTPTAAGRIAALTLDAKNAKYKLLNEVPTKSPGPAHVCLSPDGRYALVADYGGGAVEAYAIAEDGSIGERTAFIQHTGSSVNPERQSAPHPHSINASPDGRFALVPDLGLDKVFIYALNSKTGALTPADQPFAKVAPGSGPRHMVWSPSGDYCYVVNEMGASVTAFAYDSATGGLEELQTVSTLPPDSDAPHQSSEIRIHPSGKFLYAANRGFDSIAVYAVDQSTGRLDTIEIVPCGAEWPRNFVLDPTGEYLLCGGMRSDEISVLKIDQATGKLTLTDKGVEVPAPTCLRFVPQ